MCGNIYDTHTRYPPVALTDWRTTVPLPPPNIPREPGSGVDCDSATFTRLLFRNGVELLHATVHFSSNILAKKNILMQLLPKLQMKKIT